MTDDSPPVIQTETIKSETYASTAGAVGGNILWERQIETVYPEKNGIKFHQITISAKTGSKGVVYDASHRYGREIAFEKRFYSAYDAVRDRIDQFQGSGRVEMRANVVEGLVLGGQITKTPDKGEIVTYFLESDRDAERLHVKIAVESMQGLAERIR